MHQKMVEINKSKRCKSKTILFGGDILKKNHSIRILLAKHEICHLAGKDR